jgi:hypothetical protein
VLGTFAPELQRESGIIFLGVAFIEAYPQLQVRACKPCDTYIHVYNPTLESR